MVGANTVKEPAPLKVCTRPAFERAATRVLKFALLVATPAIDGRVALLVPDGVPAADDGAVGDAESLQPTTVNDSAATDRKPAIFFMTFSFVP